MQGWCADDLELLSSNNCVDLLLGLETMNAGVGREVLGSINSGKNVASI